MHELEKFVRTNEDWYPSFGGNNSVNKDEDIKQFKLTGPSIRVYAVKLRISNKLSGVWRVGVWGADDTGMEKDYLTQVEAKNLFDYIQDFITKAQLKSMGFIDG